MNIISKSKTITTIEFDNKKIVLVGTAHISLESALEAEREINQEGVDRVCVELDEQRYNSLKEKNRWRSLDIFSVLKEKKGFVLIVNLILSSFQRRMGKNLGVNPGEEMITSIKISEEKDIPITLSDRPIDITLKRAWRQCSFWSKNKLLSALAASFFSNEKISEEDIEKLKESSAMKEMMQELANYLPEIKKVLISERDEYLAKSIYSAEGKYVVAIVGAGHVQGILGFLEQLEKDKESISLDSLEELPKPSYTGKILAWIIPSLIIVIIAVGFIFLGKDIGQKMLLTWVVANSSLSFLGSLLALAHPFTILVATIVSPFTSLNPTIGAGIVAALIEAFLRKPRVSDLEDLVDDSLKFRNWYKNRVLKTLLVLFFVSLGSAIGTFAAIPFLSKLLAN